MMVVELLWESSLLEVFFVIVNLVISGITVEVTVEIEFCILFIVTTGDRSVISGLSVTSSMVSNISI
jgi:hypothetical protein